MKYDLTSMNPGFPYPNSKHGAVNALSSYMQSVDECGDELRLCKVVDKGNLNVRIIRFTGEYKLPGFAKVF